MDTKFFSEAMNAVGLPVTVIDENTDFSKLEIGGFPSTENVAHANALIDNCERDLRRKLSQGEARDLLKDNTRWDAGYVFDIVAGLERSYDNEPTGEPEPKPAFYTVAVYLEDRAYGGPEEGGWWYDCGQRIDSADEHGERNVPKIFTDEDEASAFAREVNARLNEGVNRLRRSDVNSVLSEGRYCARVCDGYPEPHYPAVTPHYE